MKRKLMLILALSGVPLFAGWFSAATPRDLAAAHDAYLRSDLPALSGSLRLALQHADPGVRQNALELAEKAYAEHGGKLPADWRLPREITSLKLGVRHMRRGDSDGYDVRLSGNVVAAKRIRQMRLVKFPNQVVLDKQDHIGTWEETTDPEDGPEFELDGPRYPTPPEEGLYLLHIELETGTTTDGWVVVSGLVSDVVPKVNAPASQQVFVTPTPTMTWVDFHSPQYQPFERRSSWLGIFRVESPESDWKEVYSLYEGDPHREQLTIGSAPGVGQTQLTAGRHIFYLDYKEKRTFGPVSLRRESAVAVPFYVSGR